MSFVKLDNLNDFINPSTACIKPVEKKVPGVVARVKDVSLSDCLACSGCITSAESVLVEQQNYKELFKAIEKCKNPQEPIETIVVSLSLQSLSSLAAKHSMTAQDTAERVASLFEHLGCHKIYDLNLARHLALTESCREFTRHIEKYGDSNRPALLSSICPGWTCYAEKTNGDLIVPHLSKVRSPQQIMGALIKNQYRLSNPSKTGANIYHLTVMPCFDKKLEASRQDFVDSQDGSRDVDCVLTPLEIEQILRDKGLTLAEFDRRTLDILMDTGHDLDSPLTSHQGSLSGGYAESIIQSLMVNGLQRSHHVVVENLTQRNEDFKEIIITAKDRTDGRTLDVRRFAIINGFRNIQTIVQRLKRKALKYDYIEVMACPSGCINGGAQCRLDGESNNHAKFVESVSNIYREVPATTVPLSEQSQEVQKLYLELGLGDDAAINKALYTDFHVVPKMQNLTVNW